MKKEERVKHEEGNGGVYEGGNKESPSSRRNGIISDFISDFSLKYLLTITAFVAV